MTGFIPDLLARRAELSPGATALEETATGQSLSYAELDRRAAKAAGLLRAHGVAEGDRVAILCRNRIAFFEILFACAKAGAILVPLNWRMPVAELNGLIAAAEPALLIHGAEDAATAEALATPLPSIDLDGNYEEAISGAAALPARQWGEEDIWYFLYTSGTTARPKGVIYTFGMAVANYVNIGSAIGVTAADTTLNFLPLFHTAGTNLHTLPALIAGARVIILPNVDADSIVSLLEQRRIDTFFGVPFVYQALLDHPRFAAAPLDRVRHWSCGGAPLPDAVAERCRALGIRVCNGMGMTETGPTAFLMSPQDAWERIGSVGKPQILSSVRIVDDEERDVADGETGEILFAGPAVTPGYWRDALATSEAFTADGWLRSGDYGRRGPDGNYYVVGRVKEMFISGGENVFPAEVEKAIEAHPLVAEAAVIGVPDKKWGEAGEAFVRASNSSLTTETLDAHCRAALAAYKVPRRFIFVEDFPRTAAGKIQKRRLIEQAQDRW